jgi:hypothetical protein
MTDSVRGALWSALVFPGSGQIVLKHWKRGLFFALVSVVFVILILVSVVKGTWAGLEQQAIMGNDITISAMLKAGLSSLKTARDFILPPMILTWLLSVLDAWRLGSKSSG